MLCYLFMYLSAQQLTVTLKPKHGGF